MKKALSIYSLSAFMLIIIGLTFKTLHWPGGTLGVMFGTLLAIIAVILLACHFSKSMPKLPTWFGALTLVALLVGGLFSICHWPGGVMFMTIAGCLSLIEFIILLVYIIKK